MKCNYCEDVPRSLPCPECYPGVEFREVLPDIRRIREPNAYRYVTWYKRTYEFKKSNGRKYYWSNEPWNPKTMPIPEAFGEGIL